MGHLSKLFSLAVFFYVASVVLLNIGFAYVPMIDFGFGMFSPMAIVAGMVFVIRDFAQRKAGHYVLVAMVVAFILSYLLANPYVALASAAAFAVAEFADYLVYTFSKMPFHQRVLFSSVISTPVDTVVFLLGINSFTVGTFVLMVLSKLVAAVAIWAYYRNKYVPISTDGAEPESYPTAYKNGKAWI